MNRFSLLPIVLLLLVAACSDDRSDDEHGFIDGQIRYPVAEKSDHTDDYHGTVVADPYRWLEEDNEQTRDWIAAQQSLTDAWLASIPAQKDLTDELTRLWDYAKFSSPIERNGRFFYFHNEGLQNQSQLYRLERLDAEPELLLDPNQFSEDGTRALSGISLSRHGRYLAYGIAESGSDWQTWRIRNTATGDDLPDVIERIKFNEPAWTRDHRGFFYARYEPPAEGRDLSDANLNQKLYYHRLGSSQDQDQLIYERPDHPDWGFQPRVSDSGRYLIISATKGTDERNRLFYRDLARADGEVVPLLEDYEAAWEFLGNRGKVFYFRTDYRAPLGRIVAVNLERTHRRHWQEIIPEGEHTLAGAILTREHLVANYLENALSRLSVHDMTGEKLADIELPGTGNVSDLEASRSGDLLFYTYQSYLQPPTIYRYDLADLTGMIFRQPDSGIDAGEFVSEQVFFESQDGTRVPLLLSYRKGMEKNGDNPTLLYGYGGFNIAILPRYSPLVIQWMRLGGIYAVANLRGGSEYGEAWHQAGMLDKKQNVFDDFIGAAEWLISENYTRPEKLAIYGRSNGGLLVGAAMTQRPDLFAAALPAVGVMDMLRFQRFTIGHAWVPEYGSSEDPDQFKNLYAYSPYHNLEPGTEYPATMVMTADHDDRVVPAHSFKFAARLQEVQAGEQPALIRIESKAGHGAGKPVSKKIGDDRDMLAFLIRSLDMEGGDR